MGWKITVSSRPCIFLEAPGRMMCPSSGRPIAYLAYWLPLSIFRASNGWISLFHITSLWHHVSATFSAFKGPVFTLCVCVCVCSVMSNSFWLSTWLDCSPPRSSVHGISQARIPKQVAISSSKRSSWLRVITLVSCVSCIGWWILYHLCHLGSPWDYIRSHLENPG